MRFNWKCVFHILFSCYKNYDVPLWLDRRSLFRKPFAVLQGTKFTPTVWSTMKLSSGARYGPTSRNWLLIYLSVVLSMTVYKTIRKTWLSSDFHLKGVAYSSGFYVQMPVWQTVASRHINLVSQRRRRCNFSRIRRQNLYKSLCVLKSDSEASHWYSAPEICADYYRLQYRVIHKSLRNFRTRLRNNQERHGRKEHINR